MANEHKKVHVPEGITFGRKVVVIPAVQMSFSHSGHLLSQYNNTYVWIDRGDPLGHYKIEVDKINVPILTLFAGTDMQSAPIPSPVSGLVLHANYDFGSGRSLTSILLPDDEPEAENGQYMFNQLLNLCSRQRKYFLKPSRYWSLGPWSIQDFESRLNEQRALTCDYVDALPAYKDYFNEIRTRHPNLRPYIKHLV